MTCDSAKIEYQGDGSTTLFTFPFEYVNTEDVKVYLWNETTFKYVLTTDWAFNSSNNSLVEFNSAPPAPTNPATINNIRIVRETNIDTLKAQFYPGASIKAQDLNDNFEQLQFAVEETRCESDSNFWKKYDDTVHSNETWESSDTQIATTAAIDASFFRQDSTETIFSGAPWSGSDSYIATTAAIDARIVDLVEEVGGFVPIDNETSFPLENPDINDGDGTLISIKEISVDRGIGGGTVTITNGAGANTVTITGVPTTGMLAGYGAIVETTSTLHTYAFHRLSPPAVEVTTVASNIGDVNTVATNITDVNTVANDITNVNTVATDITNVNTVATNITDVNAVAASIGDVNVVQDNIAAVVTVANDLNEPVSEIDTVANSIANVNIVGNDIANVNATGGSIANVNVVASQIGDVNAVAPNITEVTTVAGSIANVNTVATDITNVNTVSTNIANVNTVASNNTNVTTVATNVSDVNTTATNITNVNAVGTNITNVNTVAADLLEPVSEIDTVATNINIIDTVGTDIANVNTVATDITNVNTVATNMSSVNDFAERYRVSASAPTTSLDDGDLWWDTTSDTLKVYDATSGNWVTGVTDTAGFLATAGGTMTGALNVTTGTAAGPGVAFDGDTNTGLYSPGADQVALSTGGTGRLFIDSSGNIGIGTSSPSSPLHTYHATTDTIANFESGDASVAVNFTASDNSMQIATSGTDGLIKNNGAGNLRFFNNNSERLRIDSSGNAGIGTSAPSAPLAFGKSTYGDPSSENFYRIKFKDFGGTANDVGIGQPDEYSLGLNIEGGSTASIRFSAGTAGERMRIDGEGRVGIGTTSPARLLDVNDSADFAVPNGEGLRLGYRGETKTAYIGIDANDSYSATQSWANSCWIGFDSQASAKNILYRTNTNHIFYGVNAAERLRIDSSGRVGIGNSSPTQELCVRSTAGTEADILIEGNNGASGGLTVFHNAFDCGLWNSSSTHMRFATNNTERMRIDSSGRVGIATTSPVGPFHLVGDTSADVAGEYSILNVSDTSDTTKALRLAYDDVNDCGVVSASDRGAGWKNVVISPSGGNVGIGTSTPNASTKLHVAGSICVDNNSGLYGIDSAATSAYRIFHIGGDNNVYINANALNNQVVFQTGVNTEAMRINSSGNVGIRTSAPSYALDINSGDANAVRIRGTADNPLIMDATDSGPSYVSVQRAGTRVAYYGFGGSSNDFNIFNDTSTGDITFGTNGTEVARITDAGNVGIGTTSPSTKLHLVDASSPTILVQDTTNNVQAVFGALDSFAQIGTGTNHFFRFLTNNTERMRIDSSGNLGIGTSAPSTKLHVSSSGDTIVRVTSADGNGAFLDLGDASDPDGGRIVYDSGSNLVFNTASSERLRIGSAGQIGLSGANYGTSGQVLTSNGASSAPTWQDAAGSTLSTAVTLSSNASVTFTDVPSWAGKIIVMLGDVDTSASQHLRVRLGTSGGVISTGYVQSSHNDGGGGSAPGTDGFYWFNNDSNSGFGGLMTITKLSSTEYCQSHAGRFSDNGGNHGGGYLSGISGTIDRVEISIVSGTMTSGRINVRYEP